MDVLTKEQRSYNMSRIKKDNTKPEEIVRHYLFSKGLRYRKNVSTLPGTPDIVLKKHHTVIFVNGCFWHKHDNCKYFVWPKTNIDFWKNKLTKNAERDKLTRTLLEEKGWKVIIIWECELKKDLRECTLDNLYKMIIT
ncbi:MAG: very short patch repair endonuclease [Solobacterium sp.]|nr:very short patch repair endonuclease [Solobacterium sp.]